jgi:hypothetical protein
MAYYLAINIAVHEADSGKIRIPQALLPPEPLMPPEVGKANPSRQALFEFIKDSREKFLDDLLK